jgi:hypothetical protein
VADCVRTRASLWLLALVAACSSHDRRAPEKETAARAAQPLTPFVCEANQCTQRHPRLPDDGEWACSDVGGTALCVGGDAPAGIPKNVRDPAFVCGLRRIGNAPPTDERVCVDLAPAFPTARDFVGADGSARGWRCRYTPEHEPARICQRDASAHQIGDACDAGHPCLDGLVCTGSRCVADPPVPSCAFDRDCASGVCRFGACRNDETQAASTHAR